LKLINTITTKRFVQSSYRTSPTNTAPPVRMYREQIHPNFHNFSVSLPWKRPFVPHVEFYAFRKSRKNMNFSAPRVI